MNNTWLLIIGAGVVAIIVLRKASSLQQSQTELGNLENDAANAVNGLANWAEGALD